jgi:hypothetical protein
MNKDELSIFAHPDYEAVSKAKKKNVAFFALHLFLVKTNGKASFLLLIDFVFNGGRVFQPAI